ncbi:site-specific DNA-methyltransferase [Streptantibioticus silvisoli]|uniref:Site-specific DNA-methyltransferase n=1 Tax=Streptantibioticus silvisoli TaxID=2705255 RepID=A0ABT6VYV5_9ACTN|nr:site-specific DNA-methyltransferase [Streptantibioticus silvisoli]MDI5962927.1 site-specific DNA-methyltransferase [Streptantibioticus silvisoli]
MTLDFEPVNNLAGPGEAKSNLDVLACLFPDAVVDGTVDVDVLRDFLGEAAAPNSAEAFGLRWPGMAEARRLSTLPATGTLLPKPDESVDWDTTRNLVIEGDNLEVLRLLRRGYTNKVDVIYIDPPYNTGNDFVYDDKRTTSQAAHETVAGHRDDGGVLQVGKGSDRALDRKAGASKHTAWLSMMYPRLLVAHHLLKETGVVIVAIDDTEHARLKLLIDRVFGAENFIANIIWQGVKKNDSRYVSDSHDYMLVYAKNEPHLREMGTLWRMRKGSIDEVLGVAESFWRDSECDSTKATEMLKTWFSRQRGRFSASLTNYNRIDDEGRVYMGDNLRSPNPRENLMYDLPHPKTGIPVRRHPNGWVYSKETMAEKLAEGRILFGEDHTSLAYYKRYLEEQSNEVALSVFEQPRRSASQALDLLMGGKIFDFPKDVNVLSRWIDLVAQNSKDALILDFFAGSGTTGHAVMNLNAGDGGSRRYILVQLGEPVDENEYDTIADMTRERLRRAGQQIAASGTPDAPDIDTGFRSYRLASSNVKAWDGTAEQLDLFGAVDNLNAGRTTDDLLVEVMLRQGVDLTTPLEKREVAGSALYNLAGALFAYFGTDISVERANEVAKALVAWRDEDPGDADTTVVVRDTGFVDAAAKLNFAAALEQAGFTTLRSI